VKDGFQWCGHCGRPHALDVAVCPVTGASLATSMHAQRGEVESPSPPSTLIDGRYRLGRVIGKGAFGRVHEAENVSLRRVVAIKLLTSTSSDAARRMRQEARVLAAINHPNICNVYDVGALDDGRPFIVLERLRGETLDVRLKRETRLSVERVVPIFTQVLSALQAAHGAGIVHRDLKPENVFLVGEIGVPPTVKLLDFGLAKDLLDEGSGTAFGARCGSPTHMSPEQLRGDLLDARSDLFAVGIMLFQALAGVHPFHAGTVLEIATKIMRSRAPSIRRARPSLPAWIDEIVARALQKQPDARFHSAEEMHRALLAHQSWRQSISDDSTTNVAIARIRTSSSTTPGVR
jgi:eukaryotic-like serine/threonine-protein kinase